MRCRVRTPGPGAPRVPGSLPLANEVRGHTGNQGWPGQEDKKGASSRTESRGSSWTQNVRPVGGRPDACRLPCARALHRSEPWFLPGGGARVTPAARAPSTTVRKGWSGRCLGAQNPGPILHWRKPRSSFSWRGPSSAPKTEPTPRGQAARGQTGYARSEFLKTHIETHVHSRCSLYPKPRRKLGT